MRREGTVVDLTEDELVAAIARVLETDDPRVIVGPGDDAAVTVPGSGELVLTTDLLVEGVHFERATISPQELGVKAIAVNVSDLAAMGASPRYALASVALTPDVERAWVIELAAGMREACLEYALSLVGGDTNRADRIVVSVTAVGEVAPGHAVTRGGARPGDAIVVTGSLGAAAGGLALSRASQSTASTVLTQPDGRSLIQALARPVARVGEGRTLAAAGATAMMDLSDGLAKDLGRLCASSHVGARVELRSIPVAPALAEAADALGLDALEVALGGGEDYELLATMPLDRIDEAAATLHERFGVPLTVLGSIVEGDGVVAVSGDGDERSLEPSGWDHFA
jgi:thiamine-monophosphate kinase